MRLPIVAQADLLQELRTELLPALDAFVEVSRRSEKAKATKLIIEKLETQLGKAFLAQGKFFLRGFAQFRSRFVVEESLGSKEWLVVFSQASDETLSLFSEPLLAAVRSALQSGGNQLLARMGMMDVSFGLANPGTVRYMDQVGGMHIKQITETTRDEIHRILNLGIGEGWSYDKVAGTIRDRFEEFAIGKPQQHIQSRAHLIAVTEVGEAYEESGFLAAGDLQSGGLQMEKQWRTVGDGRVSAGCRANGGEGWLPLNQAHLSGHQHPLRFPGCRCDEAYRRVRNQ